MSDRVVVVGAGIVGVSVARELARRGVKVSVIERERGVGLGSTARTSSVVRCHYTRPEAIALANEGAAVWSEWADHVGLENPRARYVKSGVLFLLRQGEGESNSGALGVKAEMDKRNLDRRLDMMQRAGVRCELLDQREMESRFRFFSFPDRDVVGIWEPNGGFVFPPVGAVEDLEEAALRAGADFHFNTELRVGNTIWEGGRRRVRGVVAAGPEGDFEIEASAVINCAGPKSHALNVAFNCPLPLTTLPQRQFIVEGTWSNPQEGVPAMADLEEGFYIRPHREVFKVGATLPVDHVDFSDDLKSEGAKVAAEEFEGRVLEALYRRFPKVELSDVKTHLAFYDWTVVDSYPILDETEVAGYYVAIGTSGAWFKSGPVIGEMMAARVAGDLRNRPIEWFECSRTGQKIPLDAFSAQTGRRPRGGA